MERVIQIPENPSYPPVYFETIEESLTQRNQHIEATQEWIEQAGKDIRISYGLLDAVERTRAALRGIPHTKPGFAVVAHAGVIHEPSDDDSLPPNQILIKDATASRRILLPKGRRLERINHARRTLKIPQLDVSLLQKRFWRGNVAIYNGYRNGGRDKSIMVYFEQSEGI